MADKTGIDWTDATWNPIVGCSIVSPGCTNCYAMKQAHRLLDRPGSHYEGTTKQSNGGAVWTGKIGVAPDHIFYQPLRWQRPRNIFVNSMGDVFHDQIPDELIDRVFGVMALARQHTFQLLTKRSARMRDYMNNTTLAGRIFCAVQDVAALMGMKGPERIVLPTPNVWLGVSVEDQARADERIPHLIETPAEVRFLSCEPLIGPVDLSPFLGDPRKQFYNPGDREHPARSTRYEYPFLSHKDWIICGGESGQNARDMNPDWARKMRDDCKAAAVPFFMKQMAHKAEIPADLFVREWPL